MAIKGTKIKLWRASWLLGGGLLAILWGDVYPVGAQRTICCNDIIDVKGDWVADDRTCRLGGVPPEKRTEICQKLKGCSEAAKYCSAKQPPSQSAHPPSPSPLPTPTPGATKQPPPESRSSGRR